jgi:hypothetical protein
LRKTSFSQTSELFIEMVTGEVFYPKGHEIAQFRHLAEPNRLFRAHFLHSRYAFRFIRNESACLAFSGAFRVRIWV